MSGPSTRTPGAGQDRGWAWATGALLLVCVGVGVVWAAVDVGYTDAHQAPPGNPFQLVADLLTGARPWPGGWSTVLVVGVAVGLVVGIGGGVTWWVRASRSRTRVDSAARHLGRSRDLVGVTPRDAARSAARLRPGVDLRDRTGHGLLVGVTAAEGTPIRQGWEDCSVVVAGPRTGKSTSQAIPALADAPGPAAATSNKADVYDATHRLRATLGTVWLFDPQGVATGTRVPTFWWNPLAPVTSPAPARGLAEHFAANSRSADARTDAYFENGSKGLLATYLLAAALGGGDLRHVAGWLVKDTDMVPAQLLEQHGQPDAAQRVRSTAELAPAQRDGLFGGAREYLSVLDEPAYAAWVTPPRRVVFTSEAGEVVATPDTTGHDRPQFDPVAFATSTDTLYALSMEGPESASALTTALLGQVFEAATRVAAATPARRLPTPLTVVLDEAANVCKLSELPSLYSHFGSRGIVVMTIVQSAAQGMSVWGDQGFRKLWTSANLKIYGGGVGDEPWLRELSALIGDRDVSRWTRSTSQNGSGQSQTWTREPILSVADLQALPRGRAVLLSSGNQATLLRLVPWMDGPHAATIRAHLAPAVERNPLLPPLES